LFPILWDEPFGLVMVEALACGTPVIAFRRGSVPEIVEDGITGFIVENIDEMTESVEKTKTILHHECRESVTQKFSVERMVNEYEKIFSKMLSK
jgi:glycosyltransferase involved in cell wall biosynthesis